MVTYYFREVSLAREDLDGVLTKQCQYFFHFFSRN
jgi:hypothetical protein